MSGIAERIGQPGSRLVHQGAARDVALPDHAAALAAVIDAFEASGPRLAGAGLVAVAHRVVHGGARFSRPDGDRRRRARARCAR